MLIEKYDVETYTPACHPDGEHYAARARLATDITEILPYLNATLAGAVYYREAAALTWEYEGHGIAFHPLEIGSSNVKDRAGAERELAALVDLVNRTWERRAEIIPDTGTRKRPVAMTIYKLLPDTKCKRCGEPSCFSFALKLSVGEKKLGDCPPLRESKHADKRSALEALLIE